MRPCCAAPTCTDLYAGCVFGSRETAFGPKDWGLWRTVASNLEAVHMHLGSYPQLAEEDRRIVVERFDQLKAAIEHAPKSMTWKTRNLIGDKVKWYEDIEKLSDRI